MKAQSALLALLAATSLMGCTSKAPEPAGPQTRSIEISYDDFQAQKQLSRSVSLAVGDTLTISLASNPSTGFQWADKLLISEPKVLAQTGHETRPPPANIPEVAAPHQHALVGRRPVDTPDLDLGIVPAPVQDVGLGDPIRR